jgi:hypothetical protein
VASCAKSTVTRLHSPAALAGGAWVDVIEVGVTPPLLVGGDWLRMWAREVEQWLLEC